MKFKSNTEKNLYYKIPIILFCLLPFFLITGPFLADLSISVISLLFLSYCLKERTFTYFKKKYFYFFLIFWLYLIFNSLINNFNFDSLKISLFYFRYGVFVIAIVTYLNTDEKFLKYFFYCIMICFSFLVLDGFYQYFNGENIFGLKSINENRVSSLFGDEEILGGYLSRLWPIFFALSLHTIKKKNFFFLIVVVIFIFSEALIFLSGDRSAFFYINLSAIFVILFSQNLIKIRLLTLFSSILLLVIISIINPTAKERVLDKTLQQMNVINENKNENNNTEQLYFFTKAHHEIYISSYKIFLDHKIIGVGVKNFRNICKEQKYYVNKKEVCSTHSHNTYLQILTETGIIGFFFLFVALIYFCKHLYIHIILKFKKKTYFNDFEICILSAIAIYLWPFVPTGNVFSNWLNIIMVLNLPFLIWSMKLKKVRS